MPRNGSGQFSLVTNSWNQATNGQLASAGDWQNLINDIAAALTQSVSRDGQSPLTGNLNLGGNAITDLADATGTGQALTFAQLFNQGTEQDLASAATTDIGAKLTNFLRITGTTTITSFGTNYKGPRFLRFAGAVLLTNSATLALPGGANITTAAGDCLIAIPKATLGTADGWQVVAYQKNAVPGAIADNAVTYAKMQNVTAGKVLGRDTSGAGVVQELPISISTTGKVTFLDSVRVGLTKSFTTYTDDYGFGTPNSAGLQIFAATSDGTGITFGGMSSGTFTSRMQLDSSSNLKFNSGFGSVATAYGCRAWVNFNGTGTVSVRGSGNVSSIGDDGAGIYTVNFATAMPDANYQLSGTCSGISGNSPQSSVGVVGYHMTSGAYTLKSTTQCKIVTLDNSTDTFLDFSSVDLTFHR